MNTNIKYLKIYLMKQIINCKTESWPSIEFEHEKEIELFLDSFHGYEPNENTIKIFWAKEVDEISRLKKELISRHLDFDYILTFDEDILNNCKNSHFMEFGTTWVHDYNLDTIKEFNVSTLVGHKNMTIGHGLRHQLLRRQHEITIPKNFYVSKYSPSLSNGNKILLGEKTEMFNSQFHICIENTKKKNYFSEKVVDCFVTKTVPIYWGCTNINDFFDINGINICNDNESIINISNSLNENTYEKYIDAVERNFLLSQKYRTIVDRFENKLKEILYGT